MDNRNQNGLVDASSDKRKRKDVSYQSHYLDLCFGMSKNTNNSQGLLTDVSQSTVGTDSSDINIL